MKIVRVKKLKNAQYEVFFDNDKTLIIYEDVIVNNNILNKEIDESLLDNIIRDNEISKLEYEGIKHIEKKLRSVKEMTDFLSNKTDNEKTVEKIIGHFIDLKLLDDKIFSESFANDKYYISKIGVNKIIRDLENHNIDHQLITNAVSFITDDEELVRIEKIVARYVASNKKDSYIKLKNKIYLNLIEKGYPKHLINEALNKIDTDNDKAIRKQYEKMYKKYSPKYSGEELEKVVNMTLKKYGFTNEDIKKLGIES